MDDQTLYDDNNGYEYGGRKEKAGKITESKAREITESKAERMYGIHSCKSRKKKEKSLYGQGPRTQHKERKKPIRN